MGITSRTKLTGAAACSEPSETSKNKAGAFIAIALFGRRRLLLFDLNSDPDWEGIRGSFQKLSFNANCSWRGVLATLSTRPKFTLLKFTMGVPQTGVFVKLNASARNSRRTRS